jgi:hypothetical protein
VNQAVRTLHRFEPADLPAPLSHPIASGSRKIVEAVRYLPHEDDPRAILGENWIIRERDEANNILRESTELYSSADGAYYAYWYGDEPVAFEPWVSPLFATGEAA